jgi:cysteine desulfurase
MPNARARWFSRDVSGVDREGLVDLDRLRNAVTDDTLLVSAMSANNEIGVLHPLREIAAIAHAKGALFHCDAAQSAGLVRLDVKQLGVDLVSLSAHKIYGPKGIGALYVAKRDPAIAVDALIDGGGHERGYRSGTLNVPAIVGFGKAAELCRESADADTERLRALRDRLWRALSAVDGIGVNGPMDPRLPNNLNVRVAGVHGESLLKAIAGDVAVSSGAACATASAEPSHVLRAMGLSDEEARASIRFGLGRFNTEQEIDAAAAIVAAAVRHLAALGSGSGIVSHGYVRRHAGSGKRRESRLRLAR